MVESMFCMVRSAVLMMLWLFGKWTTAVKDVGADLEFNVKIIFVDQNMGCHMILFPHM